MKSENTALILIGYQNDYFAEDGILKDVLDGSPTPTEVMSNTVHLLQALEKSAIPIFITPIVFTPDYSELTNATGILKAIKEVKAFREGETGSEISPEISVFGDRIVEVRGKRGLNAFYGTQLQQLLEAKDVTHAVFAGVVTSVCIDSSARYAYENGLHITILSDCTAGRTTTEQEFYCSNIFPIYAQVQTSTELLESLD